MLPNLDDCILDHVAIATDDLEKSVQFFENLGLSFDDKREIVESQKVKTAFAHIDINAHVELLEPTSSDSTIAKFIEKKGCGIHHLCFRVENVIKKQKELESKGMKFIYESAFEGAANCLVNFIHPKSSNGILIEISQKMEKN